MDSTMQSLPGDDVETKATAFRKPSNPAVNRKYRRHSPANGSSSSEGSPKAVCSTTSRGGPEKLSEHQQRRKDDERELDRDSGHGQYGKDPNRHSNRYSSRNSHGNSRHERHANDEERLNQLSHSGRESRGATDHAREEGERGRLRDYARNADKYSRDRYDSSGHRNRDREKEFSPDRAGSVRKDTLTTSENKDRDRHWRDRHGWDEKRDHHRSFRDQKSVRASYLEESRGYRNDSRRDHDGHRYRESSKNDKKEPSDPKDKKRYDDWETNRDRDRYDRAPREQNEDKLICGSESHEGSVKKPRSFSSDRDADYNKDATKSSVNVADEKKYSKQALEVDDGKFTVGQVHANNLEAASDLNAAKVAAMRAADLVNKNLAGVGIMSTDQKKKLLWGNKKSTTTEESGRRWETASFGDRDRQEKFNKLMSLRLPWYLWPLVGCEDGAGARKPRRYWSFAGREGEGSPSPDGFREAIHCWSPAERWSDSRIRPLRINLGSFCTYIVRFCHILMYYFVRIMNFIESYFCNVKENICYLLLDVTFSQNGVLWRQFIILVHNFSGLSYSADS